MHNSGWLQRWLGRCGLRSAVSKKQDPAAESLAVTGKNSGQRTSAMFRRQTFASNRNVQTSSCTDQKLSNALQQNP